MMMERMGGGSRTTVRVVETRGEVAPRKLVAATERRCSTSTASKEPGIVICEVLADARKATTGSVCMQLVHAQLYLISRTSTASTRSTALSHAPISFGPESTSAGAAGRAGTEIVAVIVPAGSDELSRVRKEEPSNWTGWFGRMVALCPRTTSSSDGDAQLHVGVEPSADGGSTPRIEAHGTTTPSAVFDCTSSSSASALPIVLNLAATTCGARTTSTLATASPPLAPTMLTRTTARVTGCARLTAGSAGRRMESCCPPAPTDTMSAGTPATVAATSAASRSGGKPVSTS
mmetsp:Transcript_60482/g.124455  ORF Transcript_60482/g.124455 Transcript_60482/m.124455 type:complete len:290 (+) Transcript_60482:433-1302(+)